MQVALLKISMFFSCQKLITNTKKKKKKKIKQGLVLKKLILLCSREIIRAQDVFLAIHNIVLQGSHQFNTAAVHIWSFLSNDSRPHFPFDAQVIHHSANHWD